MLESFNPQTLAAMIILLASINGFAFCCYAKTQSSFRGFWQIGIGFIVLAISFVLISCRNYFSDWLTIVLSGFLAVYSIKMIGGGILRFFESAYTPYKQLCNAFLIAQPLLFTYFAIIAFDAQWRIAIICCILAIQCFFLAFKLFQIVDKVHRPAIKLLCGLFITYGSVFLLRVLWSALYYQEASKDAQSVAYISSLLTFLMMIVITSFIIIWVANDRLLRDLKRQATRDPLTNIYNRRALEAFVQKEIARSKRNGKPFSVIIADIDLFKSINDQYGHQFGDHILVQFTELLSNNLRKYDIFARFGGEEFIVIMPNTLENDALKLANKLCQLVQETHFGCSMTDVNVSITASFGVTDSTPDNSEWAQLLSRSDAALYQAKQQGRNSALCFDESAKQLSVNQHP
jgi:diguanylate cyclase (GGDEF)-like protein